MLMADEAEEVALAARKSTKVVSLCLDRRFGNVLYEGEGDGRRGVMSFQDSVDEIFTGDAEAAMQSSTEGTRLLIEGIDNISVFLF